MYKYYSIIYGIDCFAHKGKSFSKARRMSVVKSYVFFEAETLAKLREYHGSFKSICTNFSIDQNEFVQIFSKVEGFSIWDEDKNGLIDALELFSGLILYSEASFQEKIRCRPLSQSLVRLV